MLCGFTPFWDGGSPMKIYENILKGRVKYPPYIHPDAQDLLQRLITADLTKRLGNLHGGCASTIFDFATTCALAPIAKAGFVRFFCNGMLGQWSWLIDD